MDVPTPLLSPEWLKTHLEDAPLRIVDCRFSLQDPLAGRMAYLEGHLPGAAYLDLESDLSGPVQDDRTGGRHPLPEPQTLARTLSEAGIGNEHLVVAYDDSGMVAPRLWWLLRWLGHDKVAVLDGGIKAWAQAGGALVTEIPNYPKALFTPNLRPEMVLDAQAVQNRPAGTVLIDSRAPERYKGEAEPIDPIAGHIPGAINRNWADSLDASGRFKEAQAQQQRFEGLGGDLVLYCGSGVSAAANVLALEIAGLKDVKLYAGSWSDWISDKSRPIAVGEE